MTVSEINIAEKLRQFIKGYADDQYYLELPRFFEGIPMPDLVSSRLFML